MHESGDAATAAATEQYGYFAFFGPHRFMGLEVGHASRRGVYDAAAVAVPDWMVAVWPLRCPRSGDSDTPAAKAVRENHCSIAAMISAPHQTAVQNAEAYHNRKKCRRKLYQFQTDAVR